MLCLVFVDGDLLLAMEDGDLLAAMQDITPLHQKAFMRAVHAVVELGIKPPTNLWEYKVSLSVFNCLRMILYTALIWNAKNRFTIYKQDIYLKDVILPLSLGAQK